MYTLHQELTDSTFEDAFFGGISNKREAVRIARACAKTAGPDVARIIVCNTDEMTVAAIPVQR